MQRLRRLAQSGLVGEQEAAVAGAGALDEAGLVDHQLETAAARRASEGPGRFIVAAPPPAPVSNERNSGSISSQLFSRPSVVGLACAAREVGREERVRHLELLHRLRNDLLLDVGGDGGRLGDDDEVFGAELAAGLHAASRGASPARRASAARCR